MSPRSYGSAAHARQSKVVTMNSLRRRSELVTRWSRHSEIARLHFFMYKLNRLVHCELLNFTSLSQIFNRSNASNVGWDKYSPRLQSRRQLWGTGARAHLDFQQLTSNNFTFSSLWSKSDSQLSKYCIVCEISWCRCQQLTALSISTALVTKLLVIEQLLHPALEVRRECPMTKFSALPLLATNPGDATAPPPCAKILAPSMVFKH